MWICAFATFLLERNIGDWLCILIRVHENTDPIASILYNGETGHSIEFLKASSDPHHHMRIVIKYKPHNYKTIYTYAETHKAALSFIAQHPV